MIFDRISLYFYLLILALWVGGAFVLAFVVTPKTFQTVPSQSRAGTLVGTYLKTFDIWKIFFILGLVTFSLVRTSEGLLPAPSPVEVAAILFLSCSWMGQYFFLNPRMEELRQAIGYFDNAPADSPLRARFALLHRLAIFLTLGDLAAGLFLLFYVVFRLN
ncbi:MAG: DUF4149 domain-containing protein [candidate division KSB1 bacterium]|nr:DUF4149 domain-containing protein [candidate division KSB1 bacterium]MDZ7367199.1 DUF4149 domain-containing protein [candidate division KSB1 bacterium]MDZ7405318.1 DUF4149 domain-containing protein [candidate division KSB1 bacterium]